MVGDKKGGTEVQSGEADRETKSKWVRTNGRQCEQVVESVNRWVTERRGW